MRFGVSTSAAGLARTLARIGAEIEPELCLVSQAARDEWRTLQSRWRPGGGGEEVEPNLTDEEVSTVEASMQKSLAQLHVKRRTHH